MTRRLITSPLIGGPFGVVYADPAWTYRDKASIGKRGAGYKYPTMSIDEICALDVQSVIADDCLLFLWSVPPLIREALGVVEAWGFDYRTFAFGWVKLSSETGLLHWGMGNWTRANIEPCLLGVRGHPLRGSKSVHQIIVDPVHPILHSRKPAETRRRIEMVAHDQSRLELFATETVPGWTSVGYQADGRDLRDVLGFR